MDNGNKDSFIGMMLDNRYEILEKVGEGGMAVVYKARCHRLNRLVAVKVLRSELAQNEDFCRRFHAESQAVAMLSHPNIVAVYDVNRFQGVEYIVMELIDGITLKQYMSRVGKLSWREALHFSLQMVRALIHAHSKGIVHRDIKPHNIMVLRDGSVKVADFGIARVASENTLTKEALGSVHYISPEQARGGKVDSRSDIYSLGVVMFEMLTGRLPFDGDNAIAIAIQHINSMSLSPRDIEPDIPEGLEEITMKAMCADIDHRYQSTEEMYNDLDWFRQDNDIVFGYKGELVNSFDDEISEPTRKIKPSDMRTITVSSKNGDSAMDRKSSKNKSRNKSKSNQNVRDVRSRESTGNRYLDYNNRKGRGGVVAMALAVVMVLAVVGVLLYFLWQIINPILFPESNDLRVPELVGKIYDDVLNDPGKYDAEGFEIVLDAVSVYGEQPAGTITDQNPSSGRSVSGRNNVITVTVSKGPRTIKLDDFTNSDSRMAEIRLSRQNIKVTYEYETSDEIPKGTVIRTDPPAGTMLGDGESVILVLSTGPEVIQVKMPDLSGKTEDEAKGLLAHYHLNYGGSTIVESNKPSGTVVWQSIQVDMEVDEGTSVSVYISAGPIEETTSPTPEVSSSPTQPPTAEPTSDPVPTDFPSVEPSEPPVGAKSKTLTIRLPKNRETVRVTVKSDNAIIYDKTVETAQIAISVVVSGTDSVYVEVLFDGELYETMNVNFNR